MPRLPGVSDLLGLLQAQTAALMALPDTLKRLDQGISGLIKTVKSAQDTAARVDRLTKRLDDLLGALEPGLRRVASILDTDFIDDLPTFLTDLQRQTAPTLRGLDVMGTQVAAIAATTDRMMSMVDDVSERIATLPGAAALARRRAKATKPSPS